MNSARVDVLMKKSIAATGLLLLLVLLPAVSANTQQVSYVALHSVQFIGFSPASLEITYPHTTTVNSNISSLSGGRYTYKEVTSSPYSMMTFFLNASDIYTVIFELQYPVPTTGNLTWSLLSPGFLPQTGNAFINESTAVVLTFTAELLNQQIYPSANQIANATAAILINQLQQQNALQQKEIAQNNAEIQGEITDLSIVVTIIGVVVSLAILLPVLRRWISN